MIKRSEPVPICEFQPKNKPQPSCLSWGFTLSWFNYLLDATYASNPLEVVTLKLIAPGVAGFSIV